MSQEIKDAFCEVASYSNHEAVIVAFENLTAASEPEPELEHVVTPEEGKEDENTITEEQKEAESWIEKLTDPSTAVKDNEFLDILSTIGNDVLSWMVHLLSKNEAAFKMTGRASNEKKIKTWIEKAIREH